MEIGFILGYLFALISLSFCTGDPISECLSIGVINIKH